MKALLVADSDYILDSFNMFFLENGYDTICYNWLLKALDNIEEIHPHVVLINSIDYPRHWKTLVQHIYSYIDIPDLTIILVIAENFDEKEREKAKALNVYCVSGDMNQEVKEQLLGLLELKQNIPSQSNEETESIDSPAIEESIIYTEENLIEPDVQTEQESIESTEIEQDEPVIIEHSFVDLQTETPNTAMDIVEQAKESTGTHFTFNHPHTQVWINGTVEHYNHPIVLFTPSDSACLEGIRFGKKIENCILTVEGLESKINVQVQGIEDGMIEFCVVR